MTDEDRQAGHDPTRISIHCLRREKLTLDASAIIAATWDGLELFSAETLEVCSAISVNGAGTLTSTAATSGALILQVREARKRRHRGRLRGRLRRH